MYSYGVTDFGGGRAAGDTEDWNFQEEEEGSVVIGEGDDGLLIRHQE
jgi:hypothetical protein